MGLRRKRREFLDVVDGKRGRQWRMRDPLTGDVIGPVERFTLAVQGVMRKWRFVAAYTGITILWWLRPGWFGDTQSYVHWQLAASYGALLIESVVGIGMFSWARRDSMVLRKVHVLERKAEQNDENAHILLHELLRLSTQIARQTALMEEVKEQTNGHSGGLVEGDIVPGDGPERPSSGDNVGLHPESPR